MISATVVRRLPYVLVLCLLLGMTTGCNKLLANWSLGRAQKNVEKAQEHNAAQYQPDLLSQTQQKINQAQANVAQENFVQARENAKQAVDLSKDLVQRTIEAENRDFRQQAQFWIDKAKLNRAQSEDPARFEKVQTDMANALALVDREKPKYEDATEIFKTIVDEVTNYLLKNLEVRARQGLQEAEQWREELIAEGVREHKPEELVRLTRKIEEIRTLIEVDFNYRAALSARDQARQIQLEGIEATKEVKSDKLIREIEVLLDEATSLEAERYALQSFRVITKDFEELLAQFFDRNFDTVLVTAPRLKPRVEDLIVETKRSSALASLTNVQEAIRQLTQANARNYLPGRVEQLDALYDEAQNLYDQGSDANPDPFVESKERSLLALEYEKNILQDFDTLAVQEINQAGEQLAGAENVYETMQDLLGEPIPGDWSGEQLNLERTKQGLKEELGATVVSARANLALAERRREDADYRVAIETARAVMDDADFIRDQTYRIVAHNAILELSNELTDYESQGGRRYAPDELDKTEGLLEQTKTLLADGEYRDAVRRAADTKAQMQVLVQELGRVAVREIKTAENRLEAAREKRVEEYQNETFAQGLVTLERAKAALQGEGLRQAIELAEQTQVIADAAASRAVRQWAEELLTNSRQFVAKAQAAGAERYAPDRLDDALALLKNLEVLHARGAYEEAVDLGQAAEASANNAFYAKIKQAEDQIARAKRFDGWDLEPDRLAKAMISAKTAREMIDRGEYRLAEQHAQIAITTAHNVAREARRQLFESRMTALQRDLEAARHKGAGYYQVRDLARIFGEMNALRREFDFNSLDDAPDQVQVLEARVAGLVEVTPQVLEQVNESMTEQLDALEQQGIREMRPELFGEARRKIGYAERDYENERYRPSYQNAKDAQKLIDELTLLRLERDYDLALQQELRNMTDQLKAFSPILNMGLTTLFRMIEGPGARGQALSLLGAESPADVRTRIRQINGRVQELRVPETRRYVQGRALEMLALVERASANFEKLVILDQYSGGEARDIIRNGYSQIATARRHQQEIQRELDALQLEERGPIVERVLLSGE